MNTCQLFCIPLKPDCLAAFLAFSETTRAEKADEWKAMLARYDISSVKTWHKEIAGRETIFVYHDTGPDFSEKIASWNESTHPFDQWFNSQLTTLYDEGATDSLATPIVEMYV